MASIIELARAGDTQGLIALKEQEGVNFNPNLVEKGLAALHVAINKGHIATALWLIHETKANVNLALPQVPTAVKEKIRRDHSMTDMSEFTPLFLAIHMHNPNPSDVNKKVDMMPVINELLAHSSLDINTVLTNNISFPGYTALLLAINQHKTDVAKAIINKFPEDSPILTTASRSGMNPYHKAREVIKTIHDLNLKKEFNEVLRLLTEKNAHQATVMSRSVAPTPGATTPAVSPTTVRRMAATSASSTGQFNADANIASVVTTSPSTHSTTPSSNRENTGADSIAIDIPAAALSASSSAAPNVSRAVIASPSAAQSNIPAPQNTTTATILWFLGAAANFAVTAAQTISHYTRRAATAADTHLTANPGIHVGGDLENALIVRPPSSPARPTSQSMSTANDANVTAPTTANPTIPSGSVVIPIAPDAGAAAAPTPDAQNPGQNGPGSCLLL